MASDGDAGKTETVRGRIAHAAEQNYDALERFFRDALGGGWVDLSRVSVGTPGPRGKRFPLP